MGIIIICISHLCVPMILCLEYVKLMSPNPLEIEPEQCEHTLDYSFGQPH